MNIDAATTFSINTLKAFSCFVAIGILFPFAISFNQRVSSTVKFFSFLLLPVIEIVLFIRAVLKLDSLEDVSKYFIFADRSISEQISLIVALLMIFGLSLTLAFALIEDINRKLKYAIKSLVMKLF